MQRLKKGVRCEGSDARTRAAGAQKSRTMGFQQSKKWAVAICGMVLGVAAAGAQQPSSSSSTSVAAPGSAPMAPHATVPLEAYTGPRYDNRWQLYGGLLYMNGQAGQSVPDRFNMGGGELMGTYWLGQKKVKTWGVVADYRFGAGTSQVAPQATINGFNRILVMEHIFTGGVEYRTPFRNRYVAVGAHAMAGGAYGIFDNAVRNYPNQAHLQVAACPAETTTARPVSTGFYCNHTAPYGTTGISLDFNDSAKLAFRLQPDMVFEHFGTETREFFSISMGAMYRFGKTKK